MANLTPTPFTKTLLIAGSLAILGSLPSCGGGSVAEEAEAQKPNPFIVDEFLDYELKTSEDLTKGVFISGRDLKGKKKEKKKGESKIAENTKLFKVDLTGTSTTPTRATNADIGSEQQVAISGDGKWIGIVARKSGGKKIYIQSFAKSDQRVELTAHVDDNQDIKEIAFSRKAPYVLAYRTAPKSADGVRRIYVVAFNQATDDIAADAITGTFKMDAANSEGIVFSEATDGATYDLVVKNSTTAADGAKTYTFSRFPFAAITDATTQPTAVTTDAKLTKLATRTTVAKDNLLYLVRSLNKGEDTTLVTPIGDGLNKPQYDNLGDGISLTVAPGSAATVLTSTITNPVAISAPYDNSAVLLLGEEAIDCRDIGRFGTTSMAFKETGGSFKRLYMLESNGNFDLQMHDHSCELKRQKANINDKIFKDAILKKATDGFYHLFVQSSFYNDIEIYRFKFKVSGDALSEVSFLNISDNRKP